jgi:hypothetical protein
LIEDLSVHLLGRDVTVEARVVYHVTRLIAYQGRPGRIVELIEDQTGEKRLSRHKYFRALKTLKSQRE